MIDFLIRPYLPPDSQLLEQAFQKQGWHKPAQLFERYQVEEQEGLRRVLVAETDGLPIGYVTIAFQSTYARFRERRVPEISDLNVLLSFQGHGVGKALIQAAERIIKQTSTEAGIGVGLSKDYGQAQRLYCRMGYCPDGYGITYRGQPLHYGDAVTVDDDLVLWMIKPLL